MKHSDACDSNKEKSEEKEMRKNLKKIVLFMAFVHSALQGQNSPVVMTSSNACSKTYGQELRRYINKHTE
jgi:hypothetical protein